jgi:hypothetical protein
MDAQPGEEAECSPWALSREAQKGGDCGVQSMGVEHESTARVPVRESAAQVAHMRHGTCALVWVGRDLG